MFKQGGLYAALVALLTLNLAFADEPTASPFLASKGFFAGIGGSYNSVSLNNQKLYGKGVNSAYTDSVLTSSGSADGYSTPFSSTQNLLALSLFIMV